MSEQAKSAAANGNQSAMATAEEQRPRRWEPIGMLEDVQADVMRLMEQGPFGMWPFGRSFRRMPVLPAAGMPRVDVFEREGTLVVKAELPGVKKEDVNLQVEDGDLVLRAERKAEHEVREENWYRMERSSGSLYRRLPLPEGVRADQIEASLTDGVLEISIPKPAAKEPETKSIPIG